MFKGIEVVGIGLLAAAFFIRPGFAPALPKIVENHVKPTHSAAFAPDDSARLPGIDVSHYQGKIDWNAVAKSGIAFAYTKATEGITGKDARTAQNIAGAKAAGIPIGAYHFYEPGDDPIKQAEHFLSLAQVGPGSMPPVIDVEKHPKSGSTAAFSQGVLRFMDHVKSKTGCQPLLYASPSFFTQNFDKSLDGVPYWLAEYSSRARPPSGDPNWTLWQHSQTGKVPGIKGAVDLDYFAGDAAALKQILCQ